MTSETLRGRTAIEALARRFPQLYVAPSDDEQTREAYARAARNGMPPEGANLDHFVCGPDDELRVVETPAGPIETLFLSQRADFETLLQIVSHKSVPTPIARTIGAITYKGLADWGAVADAHRAYLAAGGENWGSEFSRLARQPGMFRAELVAISEGPYSNIPSSHTPYDEDGWTRVSRAIRLYHECAHVVCRRTMPDDVLPIWDEVTADVVGLICATGAYDASLAARFLGVAPDGYAGGRIIEYLDEGQAANVDALSREVYDACVRIQQMAGPDELAHPFDFLLSLKRAPLVSC